MNYTKEFKLKPYWYDFLLHFEEEKKKTFQVSYQRPTRIFTFDEEQWIFGSKSCTLKPRQVSLFIDENLEELYGKKNLTLKIFYYAPYPLFLDMRDCDWGTGSKLRVCSIIQNIFHFYNYAPRIVDLVFLQIDDKKYAAQVTEFVEKEVVDDVPFDKDTDNKKDYYNELSDFCPRNHIVWSDLGFHNIRSGKVVDFEGYQFRVDFKENLIDKVKRGLSFGGDTDMPYQSISELNIQGRRDNVEREKLMPLDMVKPEMSVLDFGCNAAYFLRRVVDRGVRKALGVDVQEVVTSCRWLHNYLGYFSIDFEPELPDRDFDIIFFLAVIDYYPKYEDVFKRCKYLMYFEGHGTHMAEEYIPLLKPYFKHIKVMGYTDDYPESGPRAVIQCKV